MLHAGQWRGHAGAGPVGAAGLAAAGAADPAPAGRARCCDVAGCCGYPTGTLAGSAYWAELRGRLAAVGRPAGGGRAARGRRACWSSTPATPTLRYGAWHGDWAPWNMANLADALLVWDWERFTHGRAARLRRAAPRAAAADPGRPATRPARWRRTVRRRRRAARAVRRRRRRRRELTALLYLVDLAARYLTDRQAEAGARLGVLGTWLLPVLIRRVEEL